MLSFEMRSDMESALLLAARLSLCLLYLHENQENNRIISVRGLEEWMVDGFRRILKSARMLPLEMCSKTVLVLL